MTQPAQDETKPKTPRPQRARRLDAEAERTSVRPVQGPPKPPSETPRGREARVDVERRERRMRTDTLNGEEEFQLIVTVPQDHATFAYRWEYDLPGRLEAMEARDWDRVEGQDPVHAYNDGLTPVNYVLMQKYRDWYEDDINRRLARNRETMDEIKRAKPAEDFGKTPDGRTAQYTTNARGEDIGISFETSDKLR